MGFKNIINSRARRDQLQSYVLIELLHKESQIITLQLHLVSQNKLKIYQRLTSGKCRLEYSLHGKNIHKGQYQQVKCYALALGLMDLNYNKS